MILEQRYSFDDEFYRKSEEALEIALSSVPAYSGWKVYDKESFRSINDRYDALPMLTKQMIRDSFPNGLIPCSKDIKRGLDREEIEYTFTSGTSGDRVINIWNQTWWNNSEQASWKLNKYTRNLNYPQREAKLASSLNVGISCEEDLPFEKRLVGDKLYLNEKISLIQWQDRHYMRMVKELNEFKPVILEANPSLLARLCCWISDRGLDVYSPEIIIFTYEFVSKIHLKVINEVFNCPTISSYGTTETGFVMQQCEHGNMHQNTKFNRIDFYPLNEEVSDRKEIGRILVTVFDNPWNSIIRFDTGDLIRLYPNRRCECKNENGLIASSIEGRLANSTFTTDKRLVTTKAFDDALSVVEGIIDYELIQKSRKDFLLLIMLSKDKKNCKDNAYSVLEEIYGGDGKYTVEVRDNILSGPAGKFRRTHAEFHVDWESLHI